MSSTINFDCHVPGTYFDYNATTPLEPSVLSIILETYKNGWGNPSSLNPLAKVANDYINEARYQVLAMLDASSPHDHAIFTSGGTESNNLVIYSILRDYEIETVSRGKGGGDAPSNGDQTKNGMMEEDRDESRPRPHVITSSIEHDSIARLLSILEAGGKIDVTWLPICPNTGRIRVLELLSAIRPTTRLITVMLANNETGVIQPIADLCSAVEDYLAAPWSPSSPTVDQNKNEETNGPKSQLPRRSAIVIHTDAAQAVGKIEVSVKGLGVDALTLVGHKFYGPRVGALYVNTSSRLGTHFRPLFFGGGQEGGHRPGTENTADIAGLGRACELVRQNLNLYTSHMIDVTSYMIDRLGATFGLDGSLNFNNLSFLTPRKTMGGELGPDLAGSSRPFRHQGRAGNVISVLPNTLNISFSGEDLQGWKVLDSCQSLVASTGAACHSREVGKGGGSASLLRSGVNSKLAANAIRLSVGRQTTYLDVDMAVQDLKQAVDRLILQRTTED